MRLNKFIFMNCYLPILFKMMDKLEVIQKKIIKIKVKIKKIKLWKSILEKYKKKFKNINRK